VLLQDQSGFGDIAKFEAQIPFVDSNPMGRLDHEVESGNGAAGTLEKASEAQSHNFEASPSGCRYLSFQKRIDKIRNLH
jgi:hypothetical protein